MNRAAMFKLSINRICIPRNSIRKSHFSSSDGYDVNRVVLCHKKLLKSKPTPYIEGWSWQQAYLNLRIDFQRKKKEFSGDELNHKISTIDRDRILFFHHEHVYTLGRGADENNLTFLSKHNEDQQKLIIERLGRKSRGKGSSRLSFERRLIDDVGCHSTVEILMKQILNFSLGAFSIECTILLFYVIGKSQSKNIFNICGAFQIILCPLLLQIMFQFIALKEEEK